MHGDGLGVHDLSHRDLVRTAHAALGEQAQQAAVGYQAGQPSLVVLDRHVAHVAPVHDAGREVDDVIGAHREQVLGHELANSAVAVTPVLFETVVGKGPFADRPAAGLLIDHGTHQAAQPLIHRSLAAHAFQ